MPTLLEDVPDMAVKFAVYESLRTMHRRVFRGRQVLSNISYTSMPILMCSIASNAFADVHRRHGTCEGLSRRY